MQLVIDEQEQGHVYTCLLVAGEKFGKAKKDLEKLDMDVAAIEEQLGINAKLKRIFNPRAEEEARAKDRAKTDPAQIDLTDVASSGETGGGIPAGQTFTLRGEGRMENAELRDKLLEIGLVMQSEDIELLPLDMFDRVAEWVTAAIAARANNETEPETPELIETHALTLDSFKEFLDAGPYIVVEQTGDDIVNGKPFEVMVPGRPTIEQDFADKLDAEIEAAYLNRAALRTVDMTDDEILDWAAKGPWSVAGDGDGEGDNFWHIVAGTQKEECEGEMDAMGRAARYNRSIAQRPLPQADYEIVEEQADIGEKEVPVEVGRAD